MLHRCKGGVQRNTHAPHKQVHMRCVSTRPQSQPHYSCSPIMTDMCRTRPKKTCLAMQPEAVEIRDIQVICNTHTHTAWCLPYRIHHSTAQYNSGCLHCTAKPAVSSHMRITKAIAPCSCTFTLPPKAQHSHSVTHTHRPAVHVSRRVQLLPTLALPPLALPPLALPP
jgi:hypothetical protein